MPIQIRRLSAEEVQQYAFFEKAPSVEPMLQEIQSSLRAYNAGEVGAVVPPDDITPRAMKRRLTVAAKREGKQLQWSKETGPELVFRVKDARRTRGPRRPVTH